MVAPSNKRFLLESDKAVADGLATLDGAGKLPDAQIPATVPKVSVLDVRDYGAKGDAVALTDATVAAGSTTLTSVTASFTNADVGKLIYIMCQNPTLFKTTIASVQSSTQITLAAAPATQSWILGGPNVVSVYGTPNSAAFNAAFAAAQAPALPVSASSSRFKTRKKVYVPWGNFLLESALTPLEASGVELEGQGPLATRLWYNEPGAMISLSTYTATPSGDAYGGTADKFQAQHLTISAPVYIPTSFENARVGTGIQDNGCGEAKLNDVTFTGLKYGFSGAYGSDYTSITGRSNFSSCDVGAYFGVGSQQVYVAATAFSRCREGIVFEGAPQWYMAGCSFEDALIAAIVLEAKPTGTTRSGVSVTLSGASYTSSAVIEGTWFETNAGNSGRLTPRQIFISGDAPNSGIMGGVVARDCYIVSGGTQVSGGHNVFIEMNSASFTANYIDNLYIRGNYINHVAKYTGTYPTCNWVITRTLPPSGGSYASGPTGSCIFDSGQGVSQMSRTFQQVTQGIPTLTLQQYTNGGGTGELFKARSQTSSAALSGMALGGALFGGNVTQTLAANGAVTIDASIANVALLTLQANATSSSITNPHKGQRLTVNWIQDGTGGRTYVWPTNCKFAGGSAPSDTTAGKTTSVTFVYDGTNWMESGRAVAVG